MNNCVFGCIFCEKGTCINCEAFIDADSELGIDILENYSKDIDTAIKPIIEKYKKLYRSYIV